MRMPRSTLLLEDSVGIWLELTQVMGNSDLMAKSNAEICTYSSNHMHSTFAATVDYHPSPHYLALGFQQNLCIVPILLEHHWSVQPKVRYYTPYPTNISAPTRYASPEPMIHNAYLKLTTIYKTLVYMRYAEHKYTKYIHLWLHTNYFINTDSSIGCGGTRSMPVRVW